MRADTPPCDGGPGGVQPLLVSGGRRVLVDGHAICGECGRAVEFIAPDEWRHAPRGRPKRAPRITLALLKASPNYRDFRARFPAARGSEDDWREAIRRLEALHAGLAAVGRRRAPRPGENPYLELVSLLGGGGAEWRPTPGLAQLLDLDERRRELASLFAWAIPTEAAIDLLARYAPLVECGAGTGYWTALARARGADVIACDVAPPGRKSRNSFHRRARGPWTAIQRGASAAIARRHADHSLVLCWPPHDDDAASYAVLRAYRGNVVIYVGEPDEGATGSVRFHRELRLNWTPIEALDLPHWPRLRDRVVVYRRNPDRRPHRERDRCFECRRFIATGAIGRCDACFARRPPALALRVGRHRVEYPREVVEAMPPALRKAFEASPNRIR
jgi:hypothetical protein